MRATLIAVFVLAGAVALGAHVTVAPRESQAGATQRYTMRVPTEGMVATTSVELEVPAGVTITEVVPGTGYTFDTKREGNRIVSVTWKKDIPPKMTGEFVFVARNPQTGPISWKARQRFADGTSADWIGVAGDRRPASVTQLTAAR
jgi:uncharacterized protein YcnI